MIDLSEKDLQSSLLSHPFKVKTKQDKSSERKKNPDAEKHRGEINGDKSVNGKDHSSAKKKEERSKTTEIESWRNKKLPAGMKIKKRVSDDERLRSTAQDGACPESPNSVNERIEGPGESKTSLKHLQEKKTTKTGMRMKHDDHSNRQITVNSTKPPTLKSAPTPAAHVQKTLTSYPGFQPASKVQARFEDPWALHSHLTAQLKQKKATLSVVNVSALPDKGEHLKSQVKEPLESLSLTTASLSGSEDKDKSEAERKASHSHSNPFSRSGGTILLPTAPAPMMKESSGSSLGLNLSQGYSQMFGVNPQSQAFYGGRMTENRQLAVHIATSEAIDHLHDSLESCPTEDTEAPDPKGIKVELLPHQRRALA